ncbi:hypothetical protein PPERSA_02033 [Pseudocohnilembus persalinus]|uniref:Uncharacterized protein n=1 Tax=Pseudocohnilembus persalinus TaxID=266149 RepID=A0A0V0QF84_PSEPJ|nr:hypothetical protein PPERSA_02033 [Pseudocohnilembus persalinus]|eukprot:KRX00854.1 hypothetical protein PPERSA_02033 [Pseudocohnilembus persalinus]
MNSQFCMQSSYFSQNSSQLGIQRKELYLGDTVFSKTELETFIIQKSEIQRLEPVQQAVKKSTIKLLTFFVYIIAESLRFMYEFDKENYQKLTVFIFQRSIIFLLVITLEIDDQQKVTSSIQLKTKLIENTSEGSIA